jgi:5-aminolevulinate synthase
MTYDHFFSAALARLQEERRYRVFADLERIAGRFPHATWRSPDGPRPVVLAHAEVVIGAGAQTLQDARKPMHTSSTVLLRT